jgi:hypothetical protein
MWNVILEDRVSRQSLSTSLSYFLQLRGMNSTTLKRSHDGAFLYSHVVPSKPKQQQLSQNQVSQNAQEMINNMSRLTPSPVSHQQQQTMQPSKLPPINLSCLTPVPYKEMQQQQQQQQQQSEQQLLPSGLVQTSQHTSTGTMVWRGIEAISESYRMYAKSELAAAKKPDVSGFNHVYQFQVVPRRLFPSKTDCASRRRRRWATAPRWTACPRRWPGLRGSTSFTRRTTWSCRPPSSRLQRSWSSAGGNR